MGDPATNHYEQQLYSMFKSFDVNNEDSLDETAVNNLCDALQLEERGAALVDTLFERRAGSGRVTFAQFRSGLLGVLGEARAPDPPPSDDCAARELAPKFVFGSKKYGRRSRPAHGAAGDEPRAASASRLESEARAQRPRYRRSTSAVERRDDEPELEHDRLIGRDDALALCRSLRMHSIDRRLIERIFEESPTPETTVGEFFDRLNSSLATAMEEGTDLDTSSASAVVERDEVESALEAEHIAEAWESVGVRRPRRLLAELGFANGARARDLERALDEELRTFDEPLEGRAALLAAALALSRLRAADATRRRDTAAAERDKLRADVAEANDRARLLAREVDESHAHIENELKTSLKRAEARHAEEIRRAAAEVAAERERVAAHAARLEDEVSRLREAEARERTEIDALRRRGDELEARAQAGEERAAAAERDAMRLCAQLRDANAAGAEAAAAAEEARVALERVAELQHENQLLRDRADELAAVLERAPPAAPHTADTLGPPSGTLSSELHSLLSTKSNEEAATATVPVSAETEFAADEEKAKLTELVKELECSLEALRGEYDACEEYWAGKLAEERAAHDAEARAAADRLADLVARIADFERRLLPPPALPAIPEAPALEAQVEEVQAEFVRYRREARARLASLAERLARAERRRAPPAPPAPPPAELAARCARAETTVRRLHARLAAADLLVKELYVENCHLAHARPLPL